MDKKQRLITLLQDYFHYSDDEIELIVNQIQVSWFTFSQSDNEIIQQVHCEYALWRGLNTAIYNYLQTEKS